MLPMANKPISPKVNFFYLLFYDKDHHNYHQKRLPIIANSTGIVEIYNGYPQPTLTQELLTANIGSPCDKVGKLAFNEINY